MAPALATLAFDRAEWDREGPLEARRAPNPLEPVAARRRGTRRESLFFSGFGCRHRARDLLSLGCHLFCRGREHSRVGVQGKHLVPGPVPLRRDLWRAAHDPWRDAMSSSRFGHQLDEAPVLRVSSLIAGV